MTLAVTLVSIKLLTNYLGASGVGEFNTITTYINFFIVIADLGLFAITVREISKKPDQEKKILANTFFIRLISAALACTIAVVLVFLTKYNASIKIGVLIATGFLFFNLLASVYDMILQARLKMQFSALAEFISRIISVIALVIIIRFHGSFFWVTSTIAIWGIFIFIFKWLFARKFVRFSMEYDKKMTGFIFNMAWPLGIVFIVSNLYNKIDTLMLFAIKGSVAAGLYTVAYKILDVTAFIGSYFSSALKPTISQNIENDKPKVANTIEKGILIMLACVAPIVFVSFAFAKEIIAFLSSPDFAISAKLLPILVLTLPFLYLDALLFEIFIANDNRKTMMKIAGFVLLLNIVLNLIAIPRFSYYGAAATTVFCEILLLIINVVLTRKIVPWKGDVKNYSLIIIASALAFVLALVAKTSGLNFIFLAVIISLFYGWLLSAFKVVDLKSIKSLLLPNKA